MNNDQNDSPPEEKCPNCGSKNLSMGYGLAGGGIGAYSYCEDCGYMIDKWQDPEMSNE